MFSSLLEPSYPKAALGIRESAISVVSLQGNKRQFSIKQAASVALPPGLITPSFTEQNISNPDEFREALREAVEAAGLLSQKRWSATLPSSTARTAIITLDSEPASRQEFEEVYDWKAEQVFGVPAAELRLARERIASDGERKARFFTTAVKLSVVDEYESQFESLGWKVGLLLPRAVGEANWLIKSAEKDADSMLISGNDEGFTALLLRGAEPAVIRSVQCSPGEVDDEVYRLVMFYNDRFGKGDAGLLDRLLVIGNGLVPDSIQRIASEALGSSVHTLTPADLGLILPATGLSFEDLAAPAGVAALGV